MDDGCIVVRMCPEYGRFKSPDTEEKGPKAVGCQLTAVDMQFDAAVIYDTCNKQQW